MRMYLAPKDSAEDFLTERDYETSREKLVAQLFPNLQPDDANNILPLIPERVPPGVNIAAHIQQAKNMRAYDLLEAFKTGGKWDFKWRYGKEYEDFGNWHYGLVTSALRLRDVVALTAAGAYQMKSGTSPHGKELSNLEMLRILLTDPFYGDDPKDQAQIQNGYKAFGMSILNRDKNKTGFRLQTPKTDSNYKLINPQRTLH
jgi:hypothetical protein